MKINVELDPTSKEIEVIIKTNELTTEVNELIKRISTTSHTMVFGFKNDVIQMIEIIHIIRIYAFNKKVFAILTTGEEFAIRMPLYELENRLDDKAFVRISNSEIISLKAIKQLDLSFTGTIAMTLKNGETVYVSRRYVSKIKKVLGL